MPTVNLYPDAHPETTTVDGRVSMYGEGFTSMGWSALRDGAGSATYTTDDVFIAFWLLSSTTENEYRLLSRSILLFDKSSLPAGAHINSGVLRIKTLDYSNDWGIPFGLTVVTSNPASNTAVVPGDYTTLGEVALSNTIPSTELALENEYYEFTFNATGLAILNGAGSIIKLGIRETEYDIANIAPEWDSNVTISFAIMSAEGNEAQWPRLTLEYTLGQPYLLKRRTRRQNNCMIGRNN
jgi:hypothetical protein